MSFLDDLKKKLQGIGAQINPFDNGATYASVVNPKPAPTPKPLTTSVSPVPTPRPGQPVALPFPTRNPALPSFSAPTVPKLPTPQPTPNSSTPNFNPITATIQSAGEAANKVLVQPVVKTFTGTVVDPAKATIASIRGDKQSEAQANKQTYEDLQQSLPGMVAMPVLNALKYTAGAITAPYAEHVAQQQADYARHILNDNTGDPVHDSAVDAYASNVKENLLNQHLMKTAGIDENTPEGTTIMHLASPFVQSAALAAGGVANEGGDAVANSLVNAGAPKIISRTVGNIAGGLPVGYGFDVGSNMDNPNKKGAQILEPGVGTAFSIALPLAGASAEGVMSAYGKLSRAQKAMTINAAANDIPIQTVPSSQLHAVDLSGYSDLDPGQVRAYKQQLQQGQQVDPLLVMKGQDGKLHVEDGKHRLAAMRQLGMKDVPVKVVTPDDIRRIAQGGYVKLPGASGANEGNVPIDTATANASGAAETPALSPNHQIGSLPNSIPAVSEEEYLAQHGAPFLGNSEPALNRQPGATEKQIKQAAMRQDAVNGKNFDLRQQLRQEYQTKVANGELRPPTREEQIIASANGHPDLNSTQAARRLAAKYGIDWQNTKPAATQLTPDMQEVADAARAFAQNGNLEQARMLADSLPPEVQATLRNEINGQSTPGNPIITFEQAKDLARKNGTTPIVEMANNLLSVIDRKDISKRADIAKSNAGRISLPNDSEAPNEGSMATNQPTPLVDKQREQIVTDYADMLKSMDSGNVGGTMVEHNAGYGAPTYTRTSSHIPEYSQFYAEHGHAPSNADWQEIARHQLDIGRADKYIQNEYNDLKNNSGYYESLFGNAPTEEPNVMDKAAQLERDAKAAGMTPSAKSPEEIARALGIAPSRVSDLLPTTMDEIIGRTTGKTPEDVATARVKHALLGERKRVAEKAVLDFLKNVENPHDREAFLSAKEIYRSTMGRDNGGEAEAARAVTQLQKKLSTPEPNNPIKVDLPDIADGDYAHARAMPQVVSSLIQNRLGQVLPVLNRLTHDDKVNFWKTVEGDLQVGKADNPKAMQVALTRWRALADTVHALNKSLGGDTPYIANYARHNWDLNDPEQLAKFQQLVNERRGGYHDPYDFGGINRMPRIFKSVQEGELAGFKLENPDNPAADVLKYANGASTALEKQALSKGFTQADMGQPLKNRSYDLRNGLNIPLSERGVKEIQSYVPTGDAPRLVKWYRAANRSAKQTVLSLSLFHPININMLQAFPTLVGRGHPLKALQGAGRSWVALFDPHFSEGMYQRFLEDGQHYNDGISTVEAAAKMGTPLRKGSDFASTGNLNFGKTNAFEKAIFDRSIGAMQGTMVQAAHADLLARGVSLDSPEALQLGLEINKIMGFVNKEVENRWRYSNGLASDVLLAPQFTRAKWSVLKDALTKWGKPGSAGALTGGYARSAVIGKYVMEATIALAAGYLVGQKSDNIRDILLRTLVHPAVPTPFKDSKGNNIEIGLPQNYISEGAGLAAGLNRGQDGHLGVEVSPSDIHDNINSYARARLGALPSTAVKAWTNTDFAGNPIRDETATPKTQAAETATNLVNDLLPISLQGIAKSDAVRSHLPQDVQAGLKVSSSGGNQIVKSLASSFGATPRTDQTTGQGLQTKQYFDALDNAGTGLNRQEKGALDLVTGSKKNPVTGGYQIMPTVYDSEAKATALLQNPKVVDRLIDMNKALNSHGQTTDPLWSLPKDQINKYFQFETINKNNTGQLTAWHQANDGWYKPLTDARNTYFNSLPAGDPNKPKLDIQPPNESPEVSGLFSQYDTLTDPKQKAQFLTDNPKLGDYMDHYTDYTNKLLSAQGLTPLKTYPKASQSLQSFMDQYNGADKATRKSIRNSNPQEYQNMIAFYDSLDLYNIGQQSAVNRLQGEPDSNSKENKAIYNLGQDIYQQPDGTYRIVPAGWMQGMSNGFGSTSSGYSSGSKYRRRYRISSASALSKLRGLLAGTAGGSSKDFELDGVHTASSTLPTIRRSTKGYARTTATTAALKKLLA